MSEPQETPFDSVMLELDGDVLAVTKDWFEKAVPDPNTKNFTTQLGVHVEEFFEMLEELTPQDEETGNALRDTMIAVKHFATHLKQKGGVHVEPDRHVKFLDALCDQLVTATGVGHMSRFDIIGALSAVNKQNFSKFDPKTGEPIFNENMKVTKGPAYQEADLTPFV